MEMTRVQALKTFFEKDAKPISSTEFMAFWKVCSTEEREAFCKSAAGQLGVTLKD